MSIKAPNKRQKKYLKTFDDFRNSCIGYVSEGFYRATEPFYIENGILQKSLIKLVKSEVSRLFAGGLFVTIIFKYSSYIITELLSLSKANYTIRKQR